MPSLDELKSVLQLGALGVLLFITIRLWVTALGELKASQEARIASEREHGKELLQVEREFNRRLVDVFKQQDMTLGSVEGTLTAIRQKLGELLEEE